jgi:NADH-quinone oxidoreductase subunit N
MMMFFMLSMAGIPPWVGFFAKLDVISAVVDAGFSGFAVVMVLASVIGAYYYLRIIWFMYFEKAENTAPIKISNEFKLVMSINGLLVLVLGGFPEWLMSFCTRVISLTL